MADQKSERVADADAARRRDEALRVALNTPPKQHKDMKLGKRSTKKPSASASKTKKT